MYSYFTFFIIKDDKKMKVMDKIDEPSNIKWENLDASKWELA